MTAVAPHRRLLLTTLSAFVLQVLPLPLWLAAARPPFAVLAVIFWSLVAPRLGGVGLGFLVGLALDVYRGVVLGQHALALAFVAYVTIRQHRLIRAKPIFEQTLFVALLLLAFEAITWAINGFTGNATGGWLRWLPVLTGPLLWPLTATWQADESLEPR